VGDRAGRALARRRLRWSNVLRPEAYARRLAEGGSPVVAREVLTPAQRSVERILLELRRAGGVPVEALGPVGRAVAERQAVEGWLDPDALRDGRAALTLRGRLVADTVALALMEPAA